MGMYNNLEDVQVKCFFSPCHPLHRQSKTIDDVRISFYSSGGALKYYIKGETVPYVTPFYNYGKNFIIFDYRCFYLDENDEMVAIIISDGKLNDIVPVSQLSNRHLQNTNLVIDNYGHPLNIKKPEDFTLIVKEYDKGMKDYHKLTDNRLKSEGVEDVMTPAFRDKILNKEISLEEVEKQIMLNTKIKDEIFKNCFEPLNEKWRLKETSDTYKDIHKFYEIGYVVYQLMSEKNTEWEKHKVVELYMEHIAKQGKEFYQEMNDYIDWLKNTDNMIFENQVKGLFKKYIKPPTEHMVKNYLNSNAYRII